MRLKRLSQTNQFKEINFGCLRGVNNAEVLGQYNEWKRVKCFRKICNGISKIIRTKYGELKCHPKHRVLTNNGEKFVIDLSEGDMLIGYNDELLDWELTSGIIEDFYDIEIEGPHWYYTSGILSHNSIMLVNTSLVNVLQGKNVLHVTLENSEKVTGHRYLGAFTNLPIAQRKKKEEEFKKRIKKIEMSTDGELFVLYFPTDTISVREVEIAIKELYRQCSFTPDLIVLDYLECLLSKNQYKNRDDYDRQKSVSSELRALAAVTNTCIFSASQTNRGGSKAAEEGENINLDKLAESFGKAMPTDYVVSINQSKKDYGEGDDSHIGNVRFFIAKNRNGPKYKTINAQINYATMKAIQEDVSSD